MREIILNEKYASLIDSTRRSIRSGDPNEDIIPLKRHDIISTNRFFDNLTSGFNDEADILPMNCRYIRKHLDGCVTFMIEDAPAIRTIIVDFPMDKDKAEAKQDKKVWEVVKDYVKGKRPHKFQLSFPYIVYFITVNSNFQNCKTSVFFRLHPVLGMGDKLFKAPLSNIGSGQSFCLGSNQMSSKTCYAEEVQNVIERFWFNEFNEDYIYNVDAYRNGNVDYVNNYLRWQYWTLRDPMFIFDVPWLLHNRSVHDELRSHSTGIGRNFNFDTMKQSFTNTRPFRISESKEKYTYNHCRSIYMDGGRYLELGDEFEWEEKTVYVTSFIGDKYGTTRYIEVEDEEGIALAIEYNPDMQKFVKALIEKKHYLDEATINGIDLKLKDIIVYKVPGLESQTTTGKVNKIKKMRDGVYQVQIGRTPYLIENLDFKKLELKTITVNGIEIEKGKTEFYYTRLAQGSRFNNLQKIVSKAVYNDISISSTGNMSLSFKYGISSDGHSDSFKVDLTDVNMDDGVCHVTSDKVEKIEDVNYGDPITCYTEFVGIRTPIKDNPHYATNDGYVKFLYDRNSRGNHTYKIYSQVTAKDEMLTMDKDGLVTEVKVPAFNYTLNLKIGDSVVIADWDNPPDMLNIKSVDSFVLTTGEGEVLNVVCTDENSGEMKATPFINFHTGTVLHSIIRKISSSAGDLKAGSKVRATEARITMFPKKDANQIIGFLEGPVPLALFSNYCTLPIEGLKDRFEIYEQGLHPKWDTTELAEPNLASIKKQSGDFYIHTSTMWQPYMVARMSTNSDYGKHTHYAVRVSNVGLQQDYELSFFSECKRYGFLAPRMNGKEQADISGTPFFPDMYGGCILRSDSAYAL